MNFLSRLPLVFSTSPQSVKVLFIIICIIIYLLLWFSFDCLRRRIGREWVSNPEDERTSFPLASNTLSYIRMLRLFYSSFIILYPHQYLHLKMKMDVSNIFRQHIPFLEREEPERGLECQGPVCHIDISCCLGEWTSAAFQKRRASDE